MAPLPHIPSNQNLINMCAYYFAILISVCILLFILSEDVCSYTITYPDGKVKFQLEYLDMEPYGNGFLCSKYIRLFDGKLITFSTHYATQIRWHNHTELVFSMKM